MKDNISERFHIHLPGEKRNLTSIQCDICGKYVKTFEYYLLDDWLLNKSAFFCSEECCNLYILSEI